MRPCLFIHDLQAILPRLSTRDLPWINAVRRLDRGGGPASFMANRLRRQRAELYHATARDLDSRRSNFGVGRDERSRGVWSAHAPIDAWAVIRQVRRDWNTLKSYFADSTATVVACRSRSRGWIEKSRNAYAACRSAERIFTASALCPPESPHRVRSRYLRAARRLKLPASCRPSEACTIRNERARTRDAVAVGRMTPARNEFASRRVVLVSVDRV